MIVECCVSGIASALAAERGGADRVELCEDLKADGVTPSAGLVDTACRRLSIPAHVLVRPRPGDFVYTPDEMEVMLRDIELAKQRGARGVVIGALDASGEVDAGMLGVLVATARPLSVTFHRAFDRVADPMAALVVLMEHGIDRVLTSGCAATARQGFATLAALVRRGEGRITILAAGSIRAGDLPPLAEIGITEVHAGSATWRESGPGVRVTDEGMVREFVGAARGLRRTPR